MMVYLVALLVFLMSFASIGFDINSSERLHQSMLSVDPWLQRLTWLGDGRVLIPLCLLWCIYLFARGKRKFPRDFRAPLTALVAWGLSGAAVQLLKTLFGRPRPYLAGDTRYPHLFLGALHWFTRDGDFTSFPSGHSTAVFAIAWIVSHLTKKSWKRALIFSIAILVALTRVALAKHFFADTMAGAAVGIFFAQLTLDLVNRRWHG